MIDMKQRNEVYLPMSFMHHGYSKNLNLEKNKIKES